ncbi:DUF3309 family protein, partial [Pseudomonas aeruginosa]
PVFPPSPNCGYVPSRIIVALLVVLVILLLLCLI